MYVTSHLKTYKYPADYYIEDYAFWVMNAINGYTLGYRNQTSVLYRRHSASLSNQHHHSLTALKISKDRIRCVLLIANHTGKINEQARIIRDGINIVQYGNPDLQAWYLDLIQNLQLQGFIYYFSKISLSPKWLRLAWYLSKASRKV